MGERRGIRALLTGRVNRVGESYTLTTMIVNPVDATTVATVGDDIASADELIGRIRGQALQVRQTLGETLASIERSRSELERVTTPSFEALRLYSKAAGLLSGERWRWSTDESRRYGAAETLLRQATEADPNFASAWLLLAHASCRADVNPSCLEPAERAAALVSGVSAVERSFILGFVNRRRAYQAGVLRQELLSASAKSYEAVLQLAPDHHWTLLELGPVYLELGRLADAGQTTVQAAAARPNSLGFGVDLARVHLRRRDTNALTETAERLLAMVPQGADRTEGAEAIDISWSRTWKAHDAWLRGDADQAWAAAREAEQRWPDIATGQWLWSLSTIYQGLGRFDDARRVIERMSPEGRAFQLPLNAARREGWPEYHREVAAGSPWLDPAVSHGFTLIWAGRLHRAEQVLAERRRRQMGPWHMLNEFEGQLRVAQGRYAEGLALLEPLTLPEIRPRLRTFELVAQARRATGDFAGALSLLESLGTNRAVAVTSPWVVHDWLRCRTLLVEIYRDLGRASEAQAVEDDVRRLLAVADAGHPLIRRLDARRR